WTSQMDDAFINALLKNGMESHLLTKSYIYLVRNHDMMRAFFGCPINMRKQVLMEMMYGDDGPPPAPSSI
ncbi:hypothetical protein CFOL_v3_27444, partial [Cephalotus follicularis]